LGEKTDSIVIGRRPRDGGGGNGTAGSEGKILLVANSTINKV